MADLMCNLLHIIIVYDVIILRLSHSYWQGVPEAPQCGFSNMACRILDAYGESYSDLIHFGSASC
jgi:glutaredoxin-related protein